MLPSIAAAFTVQILISLMTLSGRGDRLKLHSQKDDKQATQLAIYIS